MVSPGLYIQHATAKVIDVSKTLKKMSSMVSPALVKSVEPVGRPRTIGSEYSQNVDIVWTQHCLPEF